MLTNVNILVILMFMSRSNRVIDYFLLHKFTFSGYQTNKKRLNSKIPIYEVKN
jgi:hypothetical protein